MQGLEEKSSAAVYMFKTRVGSSTPFWKKYFLHIISSLCMAMMYIYYRYKSIVVDKSIVPNLIL
jgi:hypothetical protein